MHCLRGALDKAFQLAIAGAPFTWTKHVLACEHKLALIHLGHDFHSRSLKLVNRYVAVLLMMAWSAGVLAGPKEEALAAFKNFFAYFTTDNHEQLSALFAPDALFYGTISTELVTTPEGIRDYFTTALSHTRGEVMARPFNASATALADDIVLIVATWQSERTLDGKMTTNGPTRNTSVMQKRDGRWFIVQFHNSWVPKKP